MTALKTDTHNIEPITVKETDTYFSQRQETTDFLTADKMLTFLQRHSPLQVKTNYENNCFGLLPHSHVRISVRT